MKRLLLLNHFAAPRGAPGGTRHVELTERLTGWQTIVVTANRNYFTDATVEAFPAAHRTVEHRTVWTAPDTGHGISRIVNWTVYAGGALIAGLRGPRPDVVYASSPHLFAGLAAWAVARLRRAPFVLEIRDLWPRVLVDMGKLSAGSAVVRALRAVEVFLYRHADRIVVLADGVRRVLVEEEGVPADRITDIPNGADPDDFAPPATREELRRQFGLIGFVVAYTGAHGPANGLELVLDAADKIARDLPDVCFLLVGDGVVKPELLRAARERELDNVVFMDPVAKDRMPALLGAVDVGLHVLADVPLFRYGVSPNKLFDYLAAGLPVITNTPGEVGSIVEEARAGIACQPGGIADAVRDMAAADPAARAEWGANGQSYLARTRSRTALAARLQKLLDEVTG